MNITFSKATLPSGVAIFPVFEDKLTTNSFANLDSEANGQISRACKTAGFTGKKGQMLDLVGIDGIKPTRILLVGAGKPDGFSLLDAEALGGKAIATALKFSEKVAAFSADGLSTDTVKEDEIAAHLALGALLRTYRFDKYRTTLEKDQKPKLTKISIHTSETKAKSIFSSLEKVADGVFLARDLVSEPANILYPESFAERCRELEDLGVKVTVLGEKEMTKLGMGSLLGVGQGSVRESKIVAMEWMGGKKGKAPIAFVGKGVTFDTGGISLKPGPGMEDMKWDMGGSAAVTGAIAALAGRKAKANVIGVIGLVENMPDGNAQRPGDVVTAMSGKTIEILNTDAEGRLVLADAIYWTQEKYKPSTVIDLATLTGAIIISLGHEFSGVFTTDDGLAEELSQAGAVSGDKNWRMPLTQNHYDMIKSDIADMKNIGGRDSGSSTAAAFIGNFVKEGQRWAHIDIAGMAWSKKDTPVIPKGGVGYGVRLLDEWVRSNHEG